MVSRFSPQQGPPGNQSTAAFEIDASKVLRLGYKMKGGEAARIIRVELSSAVKQSVGSARDKANARVRKRSGKLQRSATTRVRVFATRIEGVVTWTARSDKGFPYPIVIESGRKAFGPKSAPFLVFKTRDGKWIRTKWVRAWPGTQFASKGLQETEPQIIGFMAAARDRIATRVEAVAVS